ncbi:hypothetical protein D3C78_1004920 [compost metagenome]
MRIDELRHRIRHQFHRRCRAATEAQFTGIELGHLRHFGIQEGRALYQAAGMLQHHQTFGGGAQVLVATVHQHAAELVFEPLNAAAEGRLGNAHGLGRAHETAVLVEGDEVTQLAKIHMLFRHPKNSSKAFATRVD